MKEMLEALREASRLAIEEAVDRDSRRVSLSIPSDGSMTPRYPSLPSP